MKVIPLLLILTILSCSFNVMNGKRGSTSMMKYSAKTKQVTKEDVKQFFLGLLRGFAERIFPEKIMKIFDGVMTLYHKKLNCDFTSALQNNLGINKSDVQAIQKAVPHINEKWDCVNGDYNQCLQAYIKRKEELDYQLRYHASIDGNDNEDKERSYIIGKIRKMKSNEGLTKFFMALHVWRQRLSSKSVYNVLDKIKKVIEPIDKCVSEILRDVYEDFKEKLQEELTSKLVDEKFLEKIKDTFKINQFIDIFNALKDIQELPIVVIGQSILKIVTGPLAFDRGYGIGQIFGIVVKTFTGLKKRRKLK